jgi:hypothetical protein
VLLKPDLVDSFTEWAECVEPRLRQTDSHGGGGHESG